MSVRRHRKTRRPGLRLASLAAAGFGLLAHTAPVAAAPAAPSTGVFVEFDGVTLDLSRSWGTAVACTYDGVTARCFHSEAEMDRSLTTGSTVVRPVRTLGTNGSSCSSALRLYDLTFQTGTVLMITARQTAIDLAVVGFDNLTSSYRVGACASNLYSGFLSNLYPGNTSAFAGANVMLTGWNNIISSVYVQ
jgi:hypothetical protein